MTDAAEAFDYIVVGSGAGGGPLAANLALAGHRVLLLEAGGDTGGPMYDVPVFHGFAAEDPEMSWSFFVRHYQRTEAQRRDSKYTAEHDGVLYPRAGTLGGCTAHNAMITIVPHPSDWDDIAALTGDDSWRSSAMQRYFERMERCLYASLETHSLMLRIWRWLQYLVLGPKGQDGTKRGGHGFDGWLSTSMPEMSIGLEDHELMKMAVMAGEEAYSSGISAHTAMGSFVARMDPNDAERNAHGNEGIVFTPLATSRGRRVGARDRIQAVAQSHPDRLTVRVNALVTRILLDAGNRAVGVEYLDGPRQYRADLRATDAAAPRREVRATREVIVSAGAFNTPQLLKLSGIGPRPELERHGIPVRADLPGVGENLQDRYEVGVVSEMATNFRALEYASFEPPVPGSPPEAALRDWARGYGIYTSNGALCGIIKRSTASKPNPDLFVFGLPGLFRGYFPGYSQALLRKRNFFTWAILKAHTENLAGQVLLRSADPRDTPDIQFHYFDEGSDAQGNDLAAVVGAIRFARRIMLRAGTHVRREIVPGPDKQTDEELGQFVKDEAWGHHASCSARMGAASDTMAVVDSRFRVRGTKGLRVVDASVFPRIPGFFIVTAVYMISEKASDVILEDARAGAGATTPPA